MNFIQVKDKYINLDTVKLIRINGQEGIWFTFVDDVSICFFSGKGGNISEKEYKKLEAFISVTLQTRVVIS